LRQLREQVRARSIAAACTAERGGTAALSTLARRRGWTPAVLPFAWVRWVLVGDDGEHDPDIYEAFARTHPDATSAIALLQVGAERHEADPSLESVDEVPVFGAPDGQQLLALLRAARSVDP